MSGVVPVPGGGQGFRTAASGPDHLDRQSHQLPPETYPVWPALLASILRCSSRRRAWRSGQAKVAKGWKGSGKYQVSAFWDFGMGSDVWHLRKGLEFRVCWSCTCRRSIRAFDLWFLHRLHSKYPQHESISLDYGASILGSCSRASHSSNKEVQRVIKRRNASFRKVSAVC